MEFVIFILCNIVAYLWYRFVIQQIEITALQDEVIRFKENQNILNTDVDRDLKYLNDQIQELKHGAV